MIVIKGTIDRFEGGKVVIKVENDQDIVIPKSYIEEAFKEGDSINVTFLTNDQATQDKENLAKDILNQIIKGSQ